MNVHALVEGPSEQAFLEPWAKRFLPGHRLKAYPHRGKGTLLLAKNRDARQQGLLDQLPAKLAAFGKSLDQATDRVLVLVDADDDDVEELDRTLKKLVSGLNPAPIVLFRFAVEELEAFYLADMKALKAAFPEFDRKQAKRYEPDSICGTWALFGHVIGDGGGNKVAWAEAMAHVLTVRAAESRSPSFKKLCQALNELVSSPVAAKTTRTKPRRAKTAVKRDATGRRRW